MHHYSTRRPNSPSHLLFLFSIFHEALLCYSYHFGLRYFQVLLYNFPGPNFVSTFGDLFCFSVSPVVLSAGTDSLIFPFLLITLKNLVVVEAVWIWNLVYRFGNLFSGYAEGISPLCF